MLSRVYTRVPLTDSRIVSIQVRHERGKEESCRRFLRKRCCAEDGGLWPSSVDLRG